MDRDKIKAVDIYNLFIFVQNMHMHNNKPLYNLFNFCPKILQQDFTVVD